MHVSCIVASPIGPLTLVSDGASLTHLSNRAPDAEAELLTSPSLWPAVFTETAAWLTRYFAGERPDTLPKLSPTGTPFQTRVWQLLRQIPYGQTVTYKSIADILAAERGGRMSARAVGGAIGRNPILILIPCHRVIGADGSLTGFGAGMPVKRQLLTLEHAAFRD